MKISLGTKAYVTNMPENYKADTAYGEVVKVLNEDKYLVRFDDQHKITLELDDYEVLDYDELPMWGTLWQFDSFLDNDWLEENIQVMSDCGFRIYKHDEWGYFFGIDGCGYDFYESHWIPLYKKRGLQWHDEE